MEGTRALQLFLLLVDAQLDICGGPKEGTQYSLSDACPDCGTGARQIGPLILRPFKLPKHEIFMTLDHELLVSMHLAHRLRARGFHCVRPVLSSAGREPLPVVQLTAEETLPPFSPASGGIARERPCGKCGRDGYFGIPHVAMALKYPSLRPPAADLLATHERFGNSRLRSPLSDSVFAAPMYVANATLGDFLKAQRINGLTLEAVETTLPPQ